jgi:hypothetical protein
MEKHHIKAIVATFLFGFFVGVYLFVTGFAGFVTRIGVQDVSDVAELTIIADSYGGCRSDCASFQVTNDGNYRYIYAPSVGEKQIMNQGSLSRKLRSELKTYLITSELKKQSVEIEPADCHSYADGIDVIYNITLAGETYILDSCGTDVDGGSKMWLALTKIWQNI